MLGTLIEYPESLEIHLDRLMNTELTAPLERFKVEVHRICDEFDEVNVITFYKEIHDDFRAVLADVHGVVDGSGAPRPVSLFARFPLLKHEPPQDFVAQCVELFFNMLEARQLQREIDDLCRTQPT